MTAELHRLVSGFGSISLADLDLRVGALATRTDRKYVVDTAVFAAMTEELAGDHLALEIAGQRAFRYDTVYFDTPELLTYYQHHQGRRRRFKCRTRLYEASGLCCFEVKLRDGRERTMKQKLVVDPAEHGAPGEEAWRFLDGVLRGVYGRPAPGLLLPTLTTAFTRLTLVAETGPERVTCDVGLSFLASDGGRFEIAPGLVVVETKTRRGNGAADRVLRRLGARPAGPCSKYCLGVALTRPDVRRNRFSRLLRRHFDHAAAPPATVAA